VDGLEEQMRNFRNFRILDIFGVQTSSVELVSRTSYKSNHKNNLFYHLPILKQSKLVEARAHSYLRYSLC
jgi:hypothetical protein